MTAWLRRVVIRPSAVGLAVALLALLITLAVRPGSVHSHFSKNQVITAALKGYNRSQFSRVEAKLMFRRNLEAATPEMQGGNPGELIWVVAVAGNYGISPSFACCSVPADYPGHNTWAIAIIVDSAATPEPGEFEVSYHGDWPPFFDGLPDLA